LKRGTLERTVHQHARLAASDRRCSYEGCRSPTKGSHFFQIDEHKKAGGRDWRELAGSVLCDACYTQFMKRGTLERTVHKHAPLAASDRRCSYEGCRNPTKGSRFYQVDEHTKAGGQDWRELAGSVLCRACYQQFKLRGTLERTVHKHERLAASDRRCSYEGCRNPTKSSKFYQIDEHTKAGGRDWRELAGSVLCDTCYSRFLKRGTLERTVHQHAPLAASDRRCSYEGCRNPTKGSRFYQIDEHKKAGGQDWRELAGSVLCHRCYTQFKKRGTLERTVHQHAPLAASARRCSYEGCKNPTKGRQFYQIDENTKAGGQDWRELAGSVLCMACYHQFGKRGTLERTVHRVVSVSASARRCRKRKAAQSHIEQHPTTSSSSSSKRPRSEQQQEEEKEEKEEEQEEEEYDERLEECFMCLGGGTRMCIVPCGHSVCDTCGDEGLFKKRKTRPFNACPVCREEMCEPWVMEGDLWVDLGGTAYDP
jgi:hypothetical protein